MEQRYETFTVLINRISRNIRKIKNQAMAKYDLRSAHVSCLYYIYTSPGLTAAELCERCEEDKATVSRALDFLKRSGYLLCPSQSEKHYKSPLLLTETGLAVGREISDCISSVLEEIGAGLSEQERNSFYRSLAIISDALDTIANNGGAPAVRN